MARFRRRLLFAALLLEASLPARAGVNVWTSIGPDGAIVHAIAVHPVNPSVVYVATSGGGILKSTDAGGSWFPINNGLVVDGGSSLWNIRALAIHPVTPTMLFAASGNYLYRSTDSGASWARLVNFPHTGGIFQTLYADPGAPTRVFLGSHRGILRSIDDGASWSEVYPVTLTLPSQPTWAFAVSPQNRDIVYTAGSPALKSVDGGLTWTLQGGGALAIATDAGSPGHVYSGDYRGVSKSVDGGATWTAANTGLTVPYVRFLLADHSTPGRLYAATDGGGIFKSTDGAATWAPASSGLTTPLFRFLALAPSNPAVIFAGANGAGVFRTTDGATTWSPRNNGLLASPVERVATHPLAVGAVFAGVYGVGVLRTNGNSGATWSGSAAGMTYPFIQDLAFAPSNPSIVFLAAFGDLFKSVDGGNTWQTKTPFHYINIQSVAVDPVNPATVYCSTYGSGDSSVFKSTDGGDTWISANNGLTYYGFNETVTSLVIHPTNPSVLYARATWIYKSADGGMNWIRISPDIGYWGSFAIDPSNPDVLYASGVRTLHGSSPSPVELYRSANAGANWSRISDPSQGFQGGDVLRVHPSIPSVLYAASEYWVTKSVDGGRHWNLIVSGLTNTTVKSLATDSADPSVLYAGIRGGGVFSLREVSPRIASLFPASGPSAGGTVVTITGTGFAPGAAVRFGNAFAQAVVVANSTTIQAIAPGHPVGTADVEVIDSSGQSGVAFGVFQYLPSPLSFFTVDPCRAADTRDDRAPLHAGLERTLPIAGNCGIPATAKAVSANVTVTEPSAAGHLTLFPAGTPLPSTSAINYLVGQTRANNVILPLGVAGDVGVLSVQASGTVHILIDVNGYFE